MHFGILPTGLNSKTNAPTRSRPMPIIRIHRAASLLLAAVFLLLTMAMPAAAATTLRMNHQFPATAAGSKIDKWFADEVERLSGGELSIKIYWAGGLGGPKENLALLGAGAIDMAAMSAGYFPAELPFFAAPNSLPMAMDNVRQASRIMQALIDTVPAYAEEAAAHGIRPVFFHLLNPYYLVSRTPVRKLEDLEGMKIRTWGEDMPKLVEAAGATPVTIFLPELYESMQRGVIDACPFSVDLVQTYKIHEVAKHITEVVMWEGPSWGIWINRATWDNLSDKQRDALSQAAAAARKRELKTVTAAADKARAALVEAGVQFHPFPVVDLATWEASSPNFFKLWVEKMDARGKGQDARRAVKLWKRMRQEIR